MTRRVLVNGVSAVTGGGITFLRGLLGHLPGVMARTSFTLLVKPGIAEELAELKRLGVDVVPIPEADGAPTTRLLWEQSRLPERAGSHDLLVSPANLSCVRWPGPEILVVQSVAPFMPEEWEGWSFWDRRLRFPTLRFLGRRSLEEASVVVVNSRATLALLEEEGLDPARARVIPLGRDPRFTAEGEAHGREGDEAPYILMVGADYRHKNIETALRALALLTRQDRDVVPRLRILGGVTDAEYRGELEELRDELGLASRVEFTGHVPYEELPAHYRGALCYLLTSRMENFPHTLVEAMGCGCPVVAGRRLPTREICGGLALEVAVDDPRSVADGLAAVIEDPGIADRMTRGGPRRAERFSWNSVARRYAELMERFL